MAGQGSPCGVAVPVRVVVDLEGGLGDRRPPGNGGEIEPEQPVELPVRGRAVLVANRDVGSRTVDVGGGVLVDVGVVRRKERLDALCRGGDARDQEQDDGDREGLHDRPPWSTCRRTRTTRNRNLVPPSYRVPRSESRVSWPARSRRRVPGIEIPTLLVHCSRTNSTHFPRYTGCCLEAFPMTGWYEWGKHADLRYEKTSAGTVLPSGSMPFGSQGSSQP